MSASSLELADPWTSADLGAGIGVPAAIGGELTPATLKGAYRRGLLCQPRCSLVEISRNEAIYGPDVLADHIPILPGPGNPYALLWWNPHKRYVISTGGVKIGRTLRRTIRDCGWTTTIDADFHGVMAGCRGHREPRWITDDLLAVHEALRDIGWTRTVEVWEGTQLVGGLFGCALGRIFIMDSAFHVRPDAAKVAIASLAHRTMAAGYTLLDAQVRTDYTIRLGAFPIPRCDYLAQLSEAAIPGVLDTSMSPASGLLGRAGPRGDDLLGQSIR